MAVDDNGPPQDIFYFKAFVIERRPCIALISKKGDHVARMVGVGGVGGIIMLSRVGEIV